VAENDVFVGAAPKALDASTAATAKPKQRIATLRMAAPFTPLCPPGDRPSFPPSHKGVKAILSCYLPLLPLFAAVSLLSFVMAMLSFVVGS
jgi:hypothetical protein